jgi:hypothetical protein
MLSVVVQDADLDDAIGVLRLRPTTPEGDREHRETNERLHWYFPVAKVSVFCF